MRISRKYEKYYKEKILKIKTSEELKYFIYNLYVEDNLTYQNILTILKIRFKNSINIEKIINTIKSFDTKKCSTDKLCKNHLGPFQPLSQFTDSPKTIDRKRPKCKTCQKFDNNYRKYDQKTCDLMNEFHQITSFDEKEKYIIELYKNNYSCRKIGGMTIFKIENIINILKKYDVKKDKMTKYFSLKSIKDRENEIINFYTKDFYTYKQIKSITGESIENIKQTMKNRDIKVCNRGKDCKTFGGPILRHKNFNKDDDYTCKYCKRYENQCCINPSRINDIEKFHKLSLFEEKESFIVKLYKNDYLTYQEIESITFFKVSEVIKIIQKNKIKRCGNKNNCKNLNGPILEISEFDKDEASIDGKTFLCKKCFQENYYNDIINNQEKRRIYQNFKSKFNVFINQIKFYHEVRRDPKDHIFLQVKCHNIKCKKWFNPTNNQVSSRINAINGYYNSLGIENNFYCSEECKNSCHLYKTKVSELITQQRLKNENYQSEDFKRMQSELRVYFLSVRNPDKCELCGEKKDQKDLILHHKIPVTIDYVVEADDDNVIFVCENCNEKAHQKDGCKLSQLKEKVIC